MAISIERVMHVNVNCSDLERSLAFYRDVVGLVPASHTHPVPQDGAGFGMSGQVQWDAHIMQDERGFAGPAVDLLEWKQPGPVGRAVPTYLPVMAVDRKGPGQGPPDDGARLGHFRILPNLSSVGPNIARIMFYPMV